MNDEQLDLPTTEAAVKPDVSIEVITPEKAAIMLQLNRRNRKVNESLVDELVRQILSDGFLFNGDTVRLSWEVPVEGPDGPLRDSQGNVVKLPILLDGQHRLHAIVKANKPVETIVVSGLDPKTQYTVDTGRKRTVGDAMRIDGEKESTNLGALLAGAWKWNSGDRNFSTKPKPSPLECQKLFKEDEARIRRALDVGLQTGREFPDLSKSSLAVAHYILSELDKEHVAYFFRLVGSGLNLAEGNPVAALRKRAASYRRQGAQQQPMTMRRQVGLIIKAWNKCVLNEPTANITQAVNERVDEPLNPMGRSLPMLTEAEFKSE